MQSPSDQLPIALQDLLANSLVLGRLVPYLPPKSLLDLQATNKTVQNLLRNAPETFRYLDLSSCKSAIVPDMSVDRGGINWRSQRMDEALTEDDIYCGPLRGIFSKLTKKHALTRVQTLVLDGLTCPADLVAEIISSTNVRILSIRECRNLNQTKLTQVLKYAVRPTRPKGTPKLRGMYVFGPKDGQVALGRKKRGALAAIVPIRGSADSHDGVTTSQGAQIGASWNTRSQDALNSSLAHCEDRWYQPSGHMFNSSPSNLRAWGEALLACEGIIAFDAVLCRGPRHDPAQTLSKNPKESEACFLPATVASITLGQNGCTTCKSCVEGPAIFGQSLPQHLPLLDPPPLHSSLIEDAQRPHLISGTKYPALYARCEECLRGRWCERCFKWWDEDCYGMGGRTSEVRQAAMAYDNQSEIRVFLGLCTQSCLVSEEMHGSGSGGMWG